LWKSFTATGAANSSFRYGHREFLVILLADEADDIVEHQHAVDRVDGLALTGVPIHQERVDDAQQLVGPLGVGAEHHQELGGAHQEAGDVERPARNREADAVAHGLDARAVARQPVEHERQQSVGGHVGDIDLVDILFAQDVLLGEGKLVLGKLAFAAERRRLGAHAELGPEPRQEHASGKVSMAFLFAANHTSSLWK
jgi:hypothetical protein